MIAIVDYGMGNLKSVVNAFHAIGEQVQVTSSPADLEAASGIVLPGVGAFEEGMNNLREAGFLPALNREVQEKKKPFLGICLGMQFLAEDSDEYRVHPSGERGQCRGFGWIQGHVVPLETHDKRFKVPHMGWNNLEIKQTAPLYEKLPEAPIFYFVHGYHFQPRNHAVISAVCRHGVEVVASVQQGNLFGVQFHPEKSQQVGLHVLKNFVQFVRTHAEKTADPCPHPA